VQVDNGAATMTAVEPWVTAGSRCIVNITWLGSPANKPSIQSDWQVFFAQTANAMSATPTFAQNQVPNGGTKVHDHSICFNGGGCTRTQRRTQNRDMLEYYTMTIDSEGKANISYPDTVNLAQQ